jgi:hypothetical protein
VHPSRTGAALLALACAPFSLACEDSYEAELSAFTGTTLPVVVLETLAQSIVDEPKVGARLALYAGGASGLGALNALTPDFEGPIGVEIRGYTSREFPKKQYGFETRDATGDDVDEVLLGMPAESDWVLHAPFMDKSLMRNHLAYELSRQMGWYAPRTRFVELFLVAASDPQVELRHYRGVYVLTEKIERGLERVPIEELDDAATSEPDIQGGYLLEWTQRKRVGAAEISFATRHAEALIIDYPKAEELNGARERWIIEHLEAFEAALAELEQSRGSESYEAFIDVDAFVDYFLLSELLRNHDVFVASTFIHKPRSGKLRMGPAWDYDRAFGDVEFGGNWRSSGWLMPSRGWARVLLTSPLFVARYRERWRLHRAGPLADGRFQQLIDETEATLTDAAARNFEKWRVLGRYVKANREPYSRSFGEEVNKLARWLHERAAWIDENIDAL